VHKSTIAASNLQPDSTHGNWTLPEHTSLNLTFQTHWRYLTRFQPLLKLLWHLPGN